MNYAEDKQYTIPAKFTAMNGAAQTFELTAGVNLVADGDAAGTAQANLLRVLEILRSNGAQPIVTKVAGTKVTFTVEQAWCYGKRGANIQVSDRELEDEALDDIEAIFGDAKAVDGTTKLFSAVTLVDTIGALEA